MAVRHTIIPDRIEAGTYIILGAAVGEGVLIDNVIPQHLESLLQSFVKWVSIVETMMIKYMFDSDRKNESS